MNNNEKIVDIVTNAVMQEVGKAKVSANSTIEVSSSSIEFSKKGNPLISIGISNRHLHITREHLDILFGKGYQLTMRNPLSQRGEFAANEAVTVIGKNGKFLANVRILGPVRQCTQIEISKTDGFTIGVIPPVQESGDIHNTPGVTIIGTIGSVTLQNGLIRANRHIHLDPKSADKMELKDKQIVKVRSLSLKPTIFDSVMVRVKDTFVPELHLDTDDANAADLSNGDKLEILIKEYSDTTTTINKRQKIFSSGNAKHLIITQEDIRDSKINEFREIIIPANAIITDIAYEYARKEGIKIVIQG